jgi:glycosyltransferase involved in cell wall biosynthesis
MRDDQPLVSVVLPFLNAEVFMQETIESVFTQTYDNWELLLVDDGSTDASTEMAWRYAQQYPEKVHYLAHHSHQNRGLSASRNLGGNHAKGQYAALLDADDVWLPEKLQRQVAILQSHPEAGMTYGPSQWWYSWTGDAEDNQRDFIQALYVPGNTLVKPPTLLSLFLQQQNAVPMPSAVLVKRVVIERIGGWEEAFRALYEDQAFYAKVCLEVPVFVESMCYCKYRRHPDSLCAGMQRAGMCAADVRMAGWAALAPVKTSYRVLAARLRFYHWLEEYLARQQVRDDAVWAALRQALWPYRHPILQRLYNRYKRHRHPILQRLYNRWGHRLMPS